MPGTNRAPRDHAAEYAARSPRARDHRAEYAAKKRSRAAELERTRSPYGQGRLPLRMNPVDAPGADRIAAHKARVEAAEKALRDAGHRRWWETPSDVADRILGDA